MPNLKERIERRLVPFASPAAGADITIVPNGLGTWRLLSLLYTFTTSAVVGVRQATFSIDDGTTTAWRGSTAVTQAATTALTYEFLPQAIPTAAVNGLVLLAMPPEGFILRRGWRFRSLTALIDVADQYSAVSAYIEELPDGPDFHSDAYQLTYEYALDTR
jgi:hypothetical protein